MSTIIPMLPELNHLSVEDLEEVHRLLAVIFGRDLDPTVAAVRWLKGRCEATGFNCTPLELLQRDEIGVVRVISYMKNCAGNSAP